MKSCCSSDCFIREHVRYGSKHICGQKRVSKQHYSNDRESLWHGWNEVYSEACKAKDCSEVHGNLARSLGAHVTLEQDPGCPSSGNTTDIAHDERYPTEDADLVQAHLPHG